MRRHLVSSVFGILLLLICLWQTGGTSLHSKPKQLSHSKHPQHGSTSKTGDQKFGRHHFASDRVKQMLRELHAVAPALDEEDGETRHTYDTLDSAVELLGRLREGRLAAKSLDVVKTQSDIREDLAAVEKLHRQLQNSDFLYVKCCFGSSISSPAPFTSSQPVWFVLTLFCPDCYTETTL